MTSPYQNSGVVSRSGRPFKSTVIRNAARCEECGDVIESVHRHDFKGCSCGKVMVDGGLEYLRRVFSGKYTDLSVTVLEEMTNEEIQEVHSWGYETAYW